MKVSHFLKEKKGHSDLWSCTVILSKLMIACKCDPLLEKGRVGWMMSFRDIFKVDVIVCTLVRHHCSYIGS